MDIVNDLISEYDNFYNNESDECKSNIGESDNLNEKTFC